MGRYQRKKENKKNSNWRRENIKKETFDDRRKKAKQIIKKAEKTALSSIDLLHFLKSAKNFIGIFSSDRLKSIYVLVEPVFFIVNVDPASKPGSHWIAIKIGKSAVEIFDSLGFNPKLWASYPKDLFSFLGRYNFSHKFYISPILQPPNTYFCGLYCVFFILYRHKISFTSCVGKFSLDLGTNNRKLGFLLNKLYK